MAKRYLDTLQLFVFPQIDDIEKEEGEILFQLGCSPLHLRHKALNALDVIFPNLWMEEVDQCLALMK